MLRTFSSVRCEISSATMGAVQLDDARQSKRRFEWASVQRDAVVSAGETAAGCSAQAAV
jgi:hypothetical protein